MKHLHECKLKRLSKELFELNSSMLMTECKLFTRTYHVDLLAAFSSAHRAHPTLHAAPLPALRQSPRCTWPVARKIIGLRMREY